MVERERRAKTETLSLRLDPKTRFKLDFMAKVERLSITMVIEKAISESAASVTIGPSTDHRGNDIEPLTWADFWDASEGVRTLRLLTSPHYPTDYADDELKAFTDVHWPFFYLEHTGHRIRRSFVDVLWPKVPSFLETWRQTKSTNYWKAGEEMAAALTSARVAAPEWPTKPPPRPQPKPAAPAFEGGIDDDIPF